MSTIHLHQTMTSAPEQFIAGLTDFGPGRAKLGFVLGFFGERVLGGALAKTVQATDGRSRLPTTSERAINLH